MPDEQAKEPAKEYKTVDHVRWNGDGWRVSERLLFRVEKRPDGAEVLTLEQRTIRTEARIGQAWQWRAEWSTDGVAALKSTICALIDQVTAEKKLGADFKAALEKAQAESKDPWSRDPAHTWHSSQSDAASQEGWCRNCKQGWGEHRARDMRCPVPPDNGTPKS